MGGMLTLRFALAHPERIRSLVFMCTAPELPGADLFERHLPRVKRLTLPDAEHHPHQENPGAWFSAIETHLDGVGQATTALADIASERTEK
jgi:pimeloyl-ACP methyl ester carboxylesterase